MHTTHRIQKKKYQCKNITVQETTIDGTKTKSLFNTEEEKEEKKSKEGKKKQRKYSAND